MTTKLAISLISKIILVLADNGFKGLHMTLNEKPELIILDLRMEEISGQEVLSKLKTNRDTKDIPVVILSVVALEN